MPKKVKKTKPAKKANKVAKKAKAKKPTAKPKAKVKAKKTVKPAKKAVKKPVAKKPVKKATAKPQHSAGMPAQKPTHQSSSSKGGPRSSGKAPKPATTPAPVPQGPIKPAGAIGRVVHFYDRIQVAIVLLSGKLTVGDKITFKRGDREFVQKIKSIQVQHKPLQHASSGQVVGLKVDEIAPEGTWLIK